MRKYALLIAVLLCTGTLRADNSGTQSPFSFGAGSRLLAQGGAALAMPDGPTAAYWNPSALAVMENFSVSGFYTRLYDSDVSYQYVGLAFPTLDYGGFGIGVFRLGIDGIQKTDEHNLSLGEISDNRLALYLAYGIEISDVDVGVALSLEHHSLDSYSSTSSPGLDLAVSRQLPLGLGMLHSARAAVVVRNVIQPGIKLLDETVQYPTAFEAALSLDIMPGVSSPHAAMLSAKVSRAEHVDPTASFGLEYTLNEFLHLRGGLEGSRGSVGGGLEYKGISFDYALTERDLGSLHLFTLSTAIGSGVSERRQVRAERRERDFNRLMSDRLTADNRQLVTDLAAKGREAYEAGNLQEADNQFDRALFMARSVGADTTELTELSGVVKAELARAASEERYQAYLDSAQSRFDTDDFATAQYFANLAKAEQPDSSEADVVLGRITKALKATSAREEMIRRRLAAADSLISFGQMDEALQTLNGLAQVDPKNELVAAALKRARFERWKVEASDAYTSGQSRRALAVLDSALTLYPGHKWCVDLKQRILAEQKNAAAPATVVEQPLSPELAQEVETAYRLAQEQFTAGNLDQAVSNWEKVERIAPGYRSVRDYLVRAYRFVGVELYGRNQLQEAVNVWQKALRLDPANKEIQGYLERTETEIKKMREYSYDRQ